MIGVLSDDDHLHLIERAQVEGIENQSARWIARRRLVFLANNSRQMLEIGLVELPLQLLFPRGFYLYIHIVNCCSVCKNTKKL